MQQKIDTNKPGRTCHNGRLGCGGEYHDRSGVINSPNFPSAYPDDSRCSWKITADANEVIALRFEHVDLAVSERENCPDSVTVYDGDTDLSPVIVRFCEYKTPEELSSIIIRSRGNQLLVKFSTDKVNHNSGFDAFYWSLACEPFKYGNESCDKSCNCVQSNTRFCHSVNGTCVCKTGWNSADCSADVNECTQSRVELCSDYQQCTNTNGSYNCECKPGMVKNSTGHCEDCPLLSYGDSCRFQCNCVANNTERCDPETGGCICKAGWRSGDCSLDINECQLANAVCEPTKICVNTIGSFHCAACKYVLNGSNGVITSLNYPNAAPPTSQCTWLISVSNPNATISLRFPKIELNDGTLTIYDGVSQGSPLIGSYRVDYDVLIRSTGNNIFILAFNSRWPSGQGFNGTYEANDCNWKYGDACEQNCLCNRSFTMPCNNLNGNCECVSGITGADCSVDIDECKINTTCHPALTCRNTFRSYECELEKTESTGKFDCYFSHYWKTYQVTIRGSPNNVISLGISDFDVHVRQDCSIDFSVFNGNLTSSQLGYYCGRKVPKLLRTTQNVMTLATINNYYGITACVAEYDTHDCLPFRYGPRCTVPCKCLKETTVSCDNVYGICACKPGFTGPDCSRDIDECTYVKNCTQNSECINTPGSYICQCLRGYTYNTVTGLCEISQECLELDRKRCSHTCYLVDGKPKCGCPEYLVLDDIVNLNCVTPFYMYSGVANSFGPSETEKKIDFNTKLPFGTKTVSSAFINKSGVIYFDNNPSMNPSIDNAHSSAAKLIAPLWAKYNPKNGSVSYQLIENCRLTDFTIPTKSFAQTEILKRAAKDVKTFRPEIYDFEVNTVLIVTWQKLQLPKRSEELTFQAIYISGYEKKVLYGEEVSDGTESSYAMFIYQKGKDKWGSGHPASIGFTNGDASIDIVKLFPGILMNLGYYNTDSKLPPGVMMLSVGNVNSHEQKCKQYLCKHVHLKSSDTYLSQINELHKCPCSLDRLALQWDLYERRDNYDCYALSQRTKVRFFSTNPRNKLCCYTRPAFNYSIAEMRSSTYLQNFPDGGHVLLSDPWIVSPNRKEALKNIEAHSSCCKSPVMCDKFFVIFPDMKCSLNVTFFTTNDYGDPHITTLDGVSYSMNAWGEFILLQSSEHKFMLQGRTSRVQSKGQLLNATVFTAFAAQQSNESRFQVELALTNTTLNVFVDGLDVTKEFYKNEYYNLSTDFITVSRGFKYNKTTVKAIFSCGVGLEVQIGNKSLDIMVQADITLKNKTRGLMGNFNDNMDDDFQMSNGTIIPRNSTERKIFMYFVKNYEVNSSTSIFTYEAGERNINYQHPEFVPMFLDEQNPLTLTAAKAFCGALNTPCIYDYIATGDANFAKSTNFTKNEYDALKSSLVNKPPIIKSLNSTTYNNTLWLVTKGKANTLQIVAADDDGDALTFIIDGKPANLSVSATGLITYIPLSIPSSSFVIKVKDAKGGYSSSFLVLLAYCSGCNNHGNCSLNSSTVINGVEKLKCHCQPAYTGAAIGIIKEIIAEFSEVIKTKDREIKKLQLQIDDLQCQLDSLIVPAKNFFVDLLACKTAKCYNTPMRKCIYTCLLNHVPVQRTGHVIETIVKELTQTTLTKIPGPTTISQMAYEISVISDLQVAEQLYEASEAVATLSWDSTTIQGCHINELHLSINGESMTLDIDRISSDRACVNHCINNCLSELLGKELLELKFNLHPLDGFAREARKLLKKVDELRNISSNIHGTEGCAANLIYRISKLRYSDKCGDPDGLKTYLKEHGLKIGIIPRYVGNRFNILFHMAGVIYQMKDILCSFLDKYCTANIRLHIKEDLEKPEILTQLRVLGEDCASELDACSLSPCQPGRACKDLSAAQQGNNPVGYICGPCPAGFSIGDDDICLDTDECKSVGVCSQVCSNTYGSFECSCRNGYRLDQINKKSCIDISRQSTCQICQQFCTVIEDTMTCGCHNGYRQDPSDFTKCIDINECSERNMPCSQVCTNTVGHYECSCYSGYRLNNDSTTCTACKSPYYGNNCNSTCECGLNGLCDPIRGCICQDGWTGEKCTVDVNECSNVTACPAGQICSNIYGRYQCNCPDGYAKINGTCKDIDECSDLQLGSFCSSELNEICVNTIGSYQCQCRTGFYRNKLSVCLDIDECSSGVDGCEQICENTVGSFNCKCYPGYWKSFDRKHCVDVKEICKDRNITCSHNCTLDTNGQPYCVCPRGYQLINSNTCQDINECTNSSLNLCSYKERCVNTEGGFTCTCPLGQTLDNNERTCLDCDGNTWGLQCANQCACGIGSLKCDPATGCFCKPGFTGRYCNEDVDECATGQQKCSVNEVCVNTPGSAECQCQNGFNRKNGVCTDINECQDKYLHNCKQSCTNTVGSFSCNCYPGYVLNTTTNICIDINECQQATHLCSGACINTEGSYSCSCSSGLVLQEDGLTCAEPYSCGSYKCSEHLKCSKIGNNHICMCHNGRLPDLNGHCIDCNRVLTDKNGIFMSTNYPSNYPDNSDCTWTITTNITNAFITLSFQSYDVEGCPYDYIEVYDGNSYKSNLIGRYCDTIPKTIMSTGNALHVVFTSDTSENQKGFLASYVSAVSCRLKKCSHNCQITATNPWTETCTCPDWMKLDSTGTECKLINACNTTINASSGYIVSPNYPSNYPDNSSCYWTIAGSNSSRVNMSFSEFSLEGGEGCPYDYISIFDGFNKSAPLLGHYCSDIIPSTTLSTKNAMHLIFKSDGSANSKGFKMFYIIQ
ncbi:hypothetical protein Btru_045273 [Bulinus truncatus]|nr:hypothetical protein Btru_045273 [Bulinus truncatus]